MAVEITKSLHKLCDQKAPRPNVKLNAEMSLIPPLVRSIERRGLG